MATDILKKIKVNSELTYKVPRPLEGTELLFEGRPKKKQHWPTTEAELYRDLDLPPMYFQWSENTKVNQENTKYDPVTGELSHLSVDDTGKLVDIRDREMKRRIEGIYFMNNGEIEYLTGNNYFFLVYYMIPAVGHPGFRKFQRDVYYVVDIAVKDPNILGVYIAKAKKTGLSHIMAAIFLNESTSIRDRSFGIMNKSQDEANDLNMVFFWRAYEELPPIMQPQFSHKNLSKVIFGAPVVKYTGTALSMQKILAAQRNPVLNTHVFTAPTKLEVKFDGPMMYFIHLDEFPKWKNVSQKKIFGKVTETVKLQQTINRKIFITSYPPEEDGAGFNEGKEIYYKSKLSTIKPGGLGRTSSGLICHFVSALDSTDGTFDIYGNADQEKALLLNQSERNQCSTPTELQEKIRQYPRTEEECWRSGGSGSVFDNIHLAEAESRINTREKEGEILYQDGNLSWENGFGSRVLFTPLTATEVLEGKKGRWRMYERYSDKVYLNKVSRDTEGFWYPDPDTAFVGAADPTEYKPKGTVKQKPSNFAITVMSFPDVVRDTSLMKTASKLIVCEYNDRMDDPDDDLDNLILTMFYFGCYFLIEGNKAWVFTKMVKLGLQRFLLVRQKDGSIRPYEQGEMNQSVTSTEDVIDAYCRLIRSYLRYPQEGEVDYCLLLKSLRLVRSLMRFDQYNTTEFDDVVSLGLALMAMQAFSVFRDKLIRESKKDKYIAQALTAICGFD